MSGQALVDCVSAGFLCQLEQALREVLLGLLTLLLAVKVYGEAIAHSKRLFKEVDHLAWEQLGPAPSGLLQLMSASQHVSQALLMRGLLESIVAGPAVMHQGARPVDAQHAL